MQVFQFHCGLDSRWYQFVGSRQTPDLLEDSSEAGYQADHGIVSVVARSMVAGAAQGVHVDDDASEVVVKPLSPFLDAEQPVGAREVVDYSALSVLQTDVPSLGYGWHQESARWW